MPNERFATDVFTSDGLGKQGQEILDYIQSKSGRTSNVKLLQPDHPGYGTGGGFVYFNSPEDVYVDPKAGGAHVLAHELGHSQFPTELHKNYKKNVLNSGSPFSPEDPIQLKTDKQDRYYLDINPKLGRYTPEALRHAYELGTVPTMLEEANAQGVAVGTTESLGLGNQEMVHNEPTDYPEKFGLTGFDDLDEFFSPEFEGRPLGVGISGTPEMRDEYYNIIDNMPMRVERAYRQGKSLVQ